MNSNEKVVSFGHASGTQALPPSMIRLRDQMAVRFREVLNDFFDRADDALFDLSDRAATNTEQTTYFDAMRELRMQRKQMSHSFQQWLKRAFDEHGQFQPFANSGFEGEVDRDSLSLVDDDSLEEQVAIDNMVIKFRNLYSEPVELLRMRLGALLKEPDMESAQNPLGPEVICHGLAQACQGLSIDIRARLVIYKLFDQLLMGLLGHIYSEANQHLIDEGILPKLRNPGPTGSAGSASARGGAVDNQGASAGPGYNFDTLAQLLHHSGGFQVGSGYGAGVRGNSGPGAADTSELVQLLSSAQSSEQGVNLGSSADLGSLINTLVQQSDKSAVRQADSDVINLVSMLFDFILEDRQLPESMKALIGRLQIPLVKVALIDRSFFEKGGHPARKLLNELSNAAMSWSGEASGRQDPLLDKMENAVSRILNEFSDDPAVFESVLEEFSTFMERDRRRRELVEKRLRDAEEGRARDELARQAVSEFIAESMRGHEVPEKIQLFLEDAWTRVLKWHWLREGSDGEGWTNTSELTQRLVWSVDPKPRSRATRPALLREIPRIVGGVREGLKQISWDPFHTDEVLRDLELVHVDVLQRLNALQDTEVDQPNAPADSAATETADFSITDEAPPGIDYQSQASPDPEDEEPPTLVDEAPQADATPEVEEAPRSVQPISDHARRVAASLSVGAWLEWSPDDDRKVRCKLAAVIRATGKYIFVNRSGGRVVEYMQDELAQALDDGRLTMLDDGMIFDRALESVIDSLRGGQKH